MKDKIWNQFVSWWKELKETAEAEDKYADSVDVSFPENTTGDCETYKHVLYLQSISRPPIESEYGKTQRMLKLSQVSACHMTKIYAIEDRGIWGPSTEPDVRMYCENCWDKLQASIWQMEMEAGPSQSEEAQYEMRNFMKFFRNWYFELFDDVETVHKYNNTCWETDELMEIFSILKIFVMTDDEAAYKLDAHMDAWKALAKEIAEDFGNK